MEPSALELEALCCGWRPVIGRTDKGRCNRLKCIKAQTHTHTAAASHCWPSLPPQGSYFSCFPSSLQWQASDNCCYCDTFVAPEEDSAAAAPLMGIRETPHPGWMLPVIDWHPTTHIFIPFCNVECETVDGALHSLIQLFYYSKVSAGELSQNCPKFIWFHHC